MSDVEREIVAEIETAQSAVTAACRKLLNDGVPPQSIAFALQESILEMAMATKDASRMIELLQGVTKTLLDLLESFAAIDSDVRQIIDERLGRIAVRDCEPEGEC